MLTCPQCGFDNDSHARFCGSCGGSLANARPVEPKAPPADGSDEYLGTVINGKFQVLRKLGEGGMGVVYEGVQAPLGRRVAIKVLHKHLSAADKTVPERFKREARSASLIEHSNSIQVYDFGEIAGDGALFMAMEFLKGKELSKVVREEFPLSNKRVVHIMSQICGALADAHDKGIIHRDMKPDNVVLVERNEDPDFVKVLDFGIAKIQEGTPNAGPALTMAGMVCGTPEYMAPEQAMGQSLDRRSDIYALGVILYELLTGDVPFTGKNYQAVLAQHIQVPPMPPRQKRPDLKIHPELERVCLKAMAKARDERYENCRQMKQEMERALTETPAPQPTFSGQPTVLVPGGGAPQGYGPTGGYPPGPGGYGTPPGGPGYPPGAPTGYGQPPQGGYGPTPNPGYGPGSQVAPGYPPGPPSGAYMDPRYSMPGGPQANGGQGKVWVIGGIVAVLTAVIAALVILGAMKGWFSGANNGTGGDATPAPSEVVAQGGGTSAVAPVDTTPVFIPGVNVNAPRNPEAARGFVVQGMEAQREGDMGAAIILFKKAIEADPDQPRPYKMLGDCFINLGNAADAVAPYRRYLQLYPSAQDRAQVETFLRSQH